MRSKKSVKVATKKKAATAKKSPTKPRPTLTLVFSSQKMANSVFGQLSDGFGENLLDLGPVRGPSSARVCTCSLFDDSDDVAASQAPTRGRSYEDAPYSDGSDSDSGPDSLEDY